MKTTYERFSPVHPCAHYLQGAVRDTLEQIDVIKRLMDENDEV